MRRAFDIERDPETGLVWIVDQRSSLLGAGSTLMGAALNLLHEAEHLYAVAKGRDDLSESFDELLAWIETMFPGIHIAAALTPESDPPAPSKEPR